MDNIESALIEWRDARQAIFDKPLSEKSKEDWNRLSIAEHRLMEMARSIDVNYLT